MSSIACNHASISVITLFTQPSANGDVKFATLLILRMIYFHLVGTDSHNLPTPLVYYPLHVSKIAVHKFALTCSRYSRTASYKYVLDVARNHRALNNHYLRSHDVANTFSMLRHAVLRSQVMLLDFHTHNVGIHQQIRHMVKQKR